MEIFGIDIPEWAIRATIAVGTASVVVPLSYKIGNTIGREQLAKELLILDGTIHDVTVEEFLENAKIGPYR